MGHLMTSTESQSAQNLIERCVAENWCHHGCGLCSGRMQQHLLDGVGLDISPNGLLDGDAARQFFESWAQVEAPQAYEHEAEWVVRRILVTFWWKDAEFADRKLFPVLLGSWSGAVLERTRQHYATQQIRRHRHEARQGIKQSDWKD